uniref:Putative secreted protein n=1 Tax=Ixodes ricinus TaxID=34613 RepID=A0A6B0UKZ9_IXORI
MARSHPAIRTSVSFFLCIRLAFLNCPFFLNVSNILIQDKPVDPTAHSAQMLIPQDSINFLQTHYTTGFCPEIFGMWTSDNFQGVLEGRRRGPLLQLLVLSALLPPHSSAFVQKN